MPSTPTSRGLALLAPAVVSIAAVAIAACGGTAAGSPNGAAASAADEARAEKFARCLREHGVQAQVDKGGGGGGFGLKVTGKAGAPSGSPQAFEAAQKACERYRPTGRKVHLSPAQEAEVRDHVLRFARCMREHGIEVPNPETKGGAVRIHIQGNVNPESPKFQSAQRACQSLMPGPKGGPGPSTQSSDGGGPSSGASLGIGG